MLTPKQSIIPLILIAVTMGLADGEPTDGQIKVALVTLALAVGIAAVTAYLNTVTTHGNTNNTKRDNIRRNVIK